ncbi:MAG: type I-MYXAN CRISPR-associated endonuclease Cas1 [Dehalococcoidia bacterium]
MYDSTSKETPNSNDEPPLRVMSLHALRYCERLFYLEEVEEIRLADDAVYSGRALHDVLGDEDPSGTEFRNFSVSSGVLGLTGRVDAYRRRGGAWTPYEHKRGRSARGHGGAADAWDTDRLQVAAYAMLLEEILGEDIHEARVRYHETGATVRVAVDDVLRKDVLTTIARARQLRQSTRRPRVTSNPRLCIRCSLAPVCLPEEERLVRDPEWEPLRLFPPAVDGKVVHVITPSTVGRSGETLVIRQADEPEIKLPVREIDSVVIHGYAQVTTQAIHLCAAHEVTIHWVSGGGRYVAGVDRGGAAVQRRVRQYEALTNTRFALGLSRRLAEARVEGQIRFLLRATRGSTDEQKRRRKDIQPQIIRMRTQLRSIPQVPTTEVVRGCEGAAARAYFEALPSLLIREADARLLPTGRSRRPPRDRFNAALSFLYALLYRSVFQAIRSVGLEPSLGFYHTPRSASPPLVLDIMELFRVPLCDLPLIASMNRRQWDPEGDFAVTTDHVWLSAQGRKRAIGVYESRLDDVWRHPSIGYSLSYARTIELEVRLLEKEWASEGGMFARARLR